MKCKGNEMMRRSVVQPHGKEHVTNETHFNFPGLAFDDWDLDYYTELFKNKLKRNPTSVECFDLAQSNSEHSRHWFFKVCKSIHCGGSVDATN